MLGIPSGRPVKTLATSRGASLVKTRIESPAFTYRVVPSLAQGTLRLATEGDSVIFEVDSIDTWQALLLAVAVHQRVSER